MTAKVSRNFACSKCDENFGKAMVWKEKLCNEIKTVR